MNDEETKCWRLASPISYVALASFIFLCTSSFTIAFLVDCSLFIVLLIVWMYFNVLCYIFCYFSLPDLFLSLSSLFPCFHLLLCMLRTSILSASFCVQFSSAVVLSPSAVPLLKILLLGQLCSIRMSYRSSIH